MEKETEEKERYNSSKEKRKQILGGTMNSGSHKKDECANENTMDVPKTMKALIKTQLLAIFCECFYKVNKHRNELKGWLMSSTKFPSKKLRRQIINLSCFVCNNL